MAPQCLAISLLVAVASSAAAQQPIESHNPFEREISAGLTVDQEHLGAGMGLTGALNNAAKVAGPIIGGFLIMQFDFAGTLQLLSLMLLLSAGAVLLGMNLPLEFTAVKQQAVVVKHVERPDSQ